MSTYKNSVIASVLVTTFVVILCLVIGYKVITHVAPYRFDTGIYVGDGIIVTTDGNEWLVDCTTETGSSVKIIFDTNKTMSLKDDEIVWVKNDTGNYEYIRED